MKQVFRKQLSMPGLLQTVRKNFSQISLLQCERATIPLSDCLMSGLAVFSLKYPSLLQFNRACAEESCIRHNLESLYGIKATRIPSDTCLRERLDEVEPGQLRSNFKTLFAQVQRANLLNQFEFWDGHYLLALDGTGYFSSESIHCADCCEKTSKQGKTRYYHQLLAGVLVHPTQSHVLPFAPEPIMKQDGTAKNDCERNAAKRFLTDFRREHPHLKVVVTEDGLASNGPHIELLKELTCSFILGAKPNDHKSLFEWVAGSSPQHHAYGDDAGNHHAFRYLNRVPLNDTYPDLEVNFLEYTQTTKKGKKTTWTWVTDIELTPSTLATVMQGGRARWRIENETFNTLKNQGYHFEHNYGHGYKHLSTVFAHLMLLAFLIDQIQQLACEVFQAAMAAGKNNRRWFWGKLRSLFFDFFIENWEICYRAFVEQPKKYNLCFDSS